MKRTFRVELPVLFSSSALKRLDKLDDYKLRRRVEPVRAQAAFVNGAEDEGQAWHSLQGEGLRSDLANFFTLYWFPFFSYMILVIFYFANCVDALERLCQWQIATADRFFLGIIEKNFWKVTNKYGKKHQNFVGVLDVHHGWLLQSGSRGLPGFHRRRHVLLRPPSLLPELLLHKTTSIYPWVRIDKNDFSLTLPMSLIWVRKVLMSG